MCTPRRVHEAERKKDQRQDFRWRDFRKISMTEAAGDGRVREEAK
jgi:hypothetical protein